MNLTVLATFFWSAANFGGGHPVELSGDMRGDWLKYAPTAETVVADEIPDEHIRQRWRKLGVRLFQRLRFDPECSPEFVRRRAGFHAVHRRADGVWLEDSEKFTAEYQSALKAAEADVEAALYCKSLADEALQYRDRDHKIWIEGRRVNWFLEFMDFDRENLDTLRLEFICYGRRLEQLLGKPSRNLPLKIAEPLSTSAKFVPLAGRGSNNFAVSYNPSSTVKLSSEVDFRCNRNGFGLTMRSSQPFEGTHPGGCGSLRLYVADGKGGYLPYEFKIDLTSVDTNRAPTDAYGLWFLRELWGKGTQNLYGDRRNWRFVAVPRMSYGSKYPKLSPRFAFNREPKGGWTIHLDFTWFELYGLWPALKNGISERWYVSLDALPGIPPVAARLDWPKGREINFAALAPSIGCGAITERYAEQRLQADGIYHLWYDERLYGYAKTREPTYQRCDRESDQIFWERVVEPMFDANAELAAITYTYRNAENRTIPAPLEKKDERTKLAVRKQLGRLFDFAERVSVARRDYILMRYAGQMPPEPPKKKPPEGAAALTAPDADNDDDAMALDDKEF